MSNELVCPFCQQELQETFGIIKQFWCSNYYNHTHPINLQGTKELWQELIRTRKALELALDWLEQVATPEKCDDDLCREFTKRKLAEIKTALEQKDVK